MRIVLQYLLITLVVIGMSFGQVNFSPYWNQGKRSGGTLAITPEECKSSMDSLIYLYKLIQCSYLVQVLCCFASTTGTLDFSSQTEESGSVAPCLLDLLESQIAGGTGERRLPESRSRFGIPITPFFAREYELIISVRKTKIGYICDCTSVLAKCPLKGPIEQVSSRRNLLLLVHSFTVASYC
ncbi:hypothetical protein V9T40_014765 [Parthenolecanium corni]|uniref:Uncharacterized protein n=1 Tax=Parthenolecanium corni TaxID=536013 RepID=A0AAN9XXZ5_9HEMI